MAGFRLFRRKKSQARATRPTNPRLPPTDPPTMAPTWVVEVAVLVADGVLLVEVLVGVGVELVVGEELDGGVP